MSDVRHILLIPADEHREALLGDGPCGARVPAATFRWVRRKASPARRDWERARVWSPLPARRMAKHAHALCLAFDGQATGPEGLARALAVLAARDDFAIRCVPEWTHYPATHDAAVWWGLGWAGGNCYWNGLGNSPSRRAFVVPALATPPDGLGDLLDLWALAVVGEARGLWRVEVIRA